jgi:hypothetical protein
MTESAIHKFLKYKIAEGFKELGYEVDIEASCPEGRIDVSAKHKDGSIINVEVINTHISEWVLVKVGSDSKLTHERQTQLMETMNVSIPFSEKRHRAFSFSIPEEIAYQIDAYCARTGMSRSHYVVQLLEAGLKSPELTAYKISQKIRSMT